MNEATTPLILIEGDKEVFKLLQKSYASHIKMIYIDATLHIVNDFI